MKKLFLFLIPIAWWALSYFIWIGGSMGCDPQNGPFGNCLYLIITRLLTIFIEILAMAFAIQTNIE